VARWDSEDSYPPIEVRLGRAWRSGWRWFVGLSVYSLLALAIVAAIDDPSFALSVPGVLWFTFLTCVPARLSTTVTDVPLLTVEMSHFG
jgi:hypothetical protein